jgi:hypothetical protein
MTFGANGKPKKPRSGSGPRKFSKEPMTVDRGRDRSVQQAPPDLFTGADGPNK